MGWVADLFRAFEGSQDEAAKRALGEWIAEYHRETRPLQVGEYRVRFGPAGADTFAASSFDRLEPASRYRVKGIAHHRIEGDVGVHTIIGNWGRSGPLEKSSDGVVPYSSSHLRGADSERIVPYGHESFDKPEVIAEIKRVLMLPPARPERGGS